MAAVAKIKISGRWDFGGNRKKFGDSVKVISGFNKPMIEAGMFCVYSTANTHDLNSNFASAHGIYLRNISAISNNTVYLRYSTFKVAVLDEGEPFYFRPVSRYNYNVIASTGTSGFGGGYIEYAIFGCK